MSFASGLKTKMVAALASDDFVSFITHLENAVIEAGAATVEAALPAPVAAIATPAIAAAVPAVEAAADQATLDLFHTLAAKLGIAV
jgi:hypothetical protein